MYIFERKMAGKICERIRQQFGQYTTKYTNLKVSTQLPKVIPDRMVWVIYEGGTETSFGEQDILVRFNVLGATWDEAEEIATLMRAFFTSEELFLEQVTDIEISSSVLPVNILDQVEKPTYYFTATFHEIAQNYNI